MLQFLFSARGRINRAKFWAGLIYYIAASLIVGLIYAALWRIIPGTVTEEGAYSVSGAQAAPYVILGFAYTVLFVWSGICLGIKRFHDRDKSGFWIFIQFVPVIGAIWYFVEAGCLPGSAGPNRFGPDPLAGTRAATALA